MRDPWNDSELIRRFRTHAEDSLPRAPLNAALCHVVADHRSLSGLLGHAPVEQQLPVLLLAAIHDLVLDEPGHPLAAWYPNLTSDHRSPDDPELAPLLCAFVDERTPTILGLLGSRRVQTNEVGRCALFLPIFARLHAEVGALAHVDVGTSAGLTTLLPRFSYSYDDGPWIGDSDAVMIGCSTRGDVPDVGEIPEVPTARGIDVDPIDVTDPDDARWLQACCWPDQTDRFVRLSAAIEIARRHPPVVHRGDALDLLQPVVGEAGGSAHPVVTNSWVLNYFPPAARRRFVEQLDEIGAERDLSWVSAESPAMTPELPHAPDLAGEHTTALTLVTWRSGVREVEHLATCHPHGYWIHWRP